MGGVLNGKATSLVKPVYPESLKAAKVGGLVMVSVLIDEGGNVISAVADECDGQEPAPRQGDCKKVDMGLRQAAEQAALESRFSPTLLSGTPVQVKGVITYNFSATTAKTVSGGVLNGKASSLPVPAYPPAARAVKAEGTVSVQVVVDETGKVVSASAVSGHPLLQASAVDAALRATFSPTQLSGVPVKITGILTFNFVP